MFTTNTPPRALAAILVVAASLLTACDAQPPPLPAATSFQAELGALAVAPAEARHLTEFADSPYTHFAVAWDQLRWLRQYLLTVVAVPAGAIERAADQDAVRSSEADWAWDVRLMDIDFTVQATGSASEGYELSFVADSPDFGLSDFRWVTGHLGANPGTGQWVLHDQDFAGGSNAVMQIDWETLAHDQRTQVYTNLKAGHPDEGDQIAFQRTGSSATIVYHDASQPDWSATLTWDIETGAGSVVIPTYNQGQPSCWGETFENQACPEPAPE